jgi:hypothetical protein
MRLLRLYPRQFRERYEDEMLAVLEQHDVTLATHLDLLRAAWDAWLPQRRSVMAHTLGIARRSALLGLVPSAFVLAQFLLGFVAPRVDSTILNTVGLASMLVTLPICLGAATWELRRGGAWRACLIAGAVAGAVAMLAQMALHDALTFLDLAFGITAFMLGAQGYHMFMIGTVASAAGVTFSPSSLLVGLAATLVVSALGAAIGGLTGSAAARVRGLRATA